MLSLIISSYNKDFFTQFEGSVQNTIGIPYEIIPIHNPGIMGICAAYNKGAAMAKYDMLCFVHEDLIFLTQDWGKAVMEHFKDAGVGAIGVAGSTFKSQIPSSWATVEDVKAVNIIQHYKFDKANKKEHHVVKHTPANSAEAVTLDGVFIVTRKSIWQQIKFDEKMLTDFHGYDIDFSFAISRHYKLYVVYDILIEHFSEGKLDKRWLEAVQDVSNKWKDSLPAAVATLSAATLNAYQKSVLYTYLFDLYRLGFSLKDILKGAFKYGGNNLYNAGYYIYILKILKLRLKTES